MQIKSFCVNKFLHAFSFGILRKIDTSTQGNGHQTANLNRCIDMFSISSLIKADFLS